MPTTSEPLRIAAGLASKRAAGGASVAVGGLLIGLFHARIGAASFGRR